MANTYTLIASNTVGAGGVASVTFSSIPQVYTDLVIKASPRDTNSSGSNGAFSIQPNGDTTAGDYQATLYILGNGSTTGAYTKTGAFVDGSMNASLDSAGNTANTFSSVEVYMPNYTSSNYKSFSIESVMEQNGTAAYMGLLAGLWKVASAITSITINSTTAFAQYSSFYLYGIKNS